MHRRTRQGNGKNVPVPAALFCRGYNSYITFVYQNGENCCDQFTFSQYKFKKMRLRPGLCPIPRWGSFRDEALQTPDLLVGWGGEYLLHFLSPPTPLTYQLSPPRHAVPVQQPTDCYKPAPGCGHTRAVNSHMIYWTVATLLTTLKRFSVKNFTQLRIYYIECN